MVSTFILLDVTEKRIFRATVTDGTAASASWSLSPAGTSKTEGPVGDALIGPFAAGTHIVECDLTTTDGQILNYRWRVTAE